MAPSRPAPPSKRSAANDSASASSEPLGVDLSRAPGPSFERQNRAARDDGTHGRADNSLENVLVAFVGGEVGDHLFQLIETRLEQFGMHLVVLPLRPSLVVLLPAQSEETGAVTPALALLFDDLGSRETEVHRDGGVLARDEGAELGVGCETLDEPLAHRPLVRCHFSHLVAPHGHHRVGTVTASQDSRGRIEGLHNLSDDGGGRQINIKTHCLKRRVQ